MPRDFPDQGAYGSKLVKQPNSLSIMEEPVCNNLKATSYTYDGTGVQKEGISAAGENRIKRMDK